MIPQNQRLNHEHTDDLINDLDCLLVALDLLRDSITDATPSREANAVGGLLNMTLAKFSEIAKARAMEWVGIGGFSGIPTESEVAQARRQEGGA